MNRPNIFEYLGYRNFLKDMFAFRKSENPSFSFRVFSKMAGLSSSNFLKLVMDGKRNLSAGAIFKFAKAMKLKKDETRFFETLVYFDQSKNADEKNAQYEKILQTKSYHDVRPLETHQYAYFSNWHFVAIRELVLLKNFKEDYAWINKKLGARLYAEEIRRAIQILIDLNLLRRNSGGLLEQTEGKLTTTPEMGSLALINFHREMLKKAGESLEKTRTANRDISALTVAVSKKQFEKIRERLNQVRREIHAIASEKDAYESVYQINFQMFNLSEVTWA